MFDFSSPDFWVVAAAGIAVGLFLGWLIASLLQRRANAGASVAGLRKEMEDYREEVNTHFAHTAELFKDTTEKYRDLYEHLAGGAQELCNDLPDRARVEFRPGHLLPASGAEAGDVAEAVVAAPDNGNGAGVPVEAASGEVSGAPRENGASEELRPPANAA